MAIGSPIFKKHSIANKGKKKKENLWSRINYTSQQGERDQMYLTRKKFPKAEEFHQKTKRRKN